MKQRLGGDGRAPTGRFMALLVGSESRNPQEMGSTVEYSVEGCPHDEHLEIGRKRHMTSPRELMDLDIDNQSAGMTIWRSDSTRWEVLFCLGSLVRYLNCELD